MKKFVLSMIALLVASSTAMAQDFETFTVKGVSFKMVKVEGGTFTMGATPEQGRDVEDAEKPVHKVSINSFSIGETEVTQALWDALMTFARINPKTGKEAELSENEKNIAVHGLSWDDCQRFIAKLNKVTGRHFRLPTEAEWEFAARGGNKSRKTKYAGSNNLDNVAWYFDNSHREKVRPVKKKAANELGIYDMTGNVSEWCQDWYSPYSSKPQTNPKGPETGTKRVIRGGDWGSTERRCNISDREGRKPDDNYTNFGFRLAL